MSALAGSRVRGRALPWVATLALAAAACDALITDPAPPATTMDVSFAVEGADPAGSAAAFSKVNRVRLRLVRPDSVSRDTILKVFPDGGLARARLVLENRERVQALGVQAELRAGVLPLFEGARVVRIQVGAPTSAEVPLVAVPARVRADRDVLVLATGDTVRLSARVLFATGDLLAATGGSWSSADPEVVSITPAGLALGRKPGETRLFVRTRAAEDTVLARVQPRQ